MIRLATLGLSVALAVGAAGSASAAPDRATIAHIAEIPAGPAPAPTEQASRYAERERHDRRAADYEGGNFIVIGVSGSALVVVLLALLLI